MKTLVLGAGNLLLGDEGFGVHFIRYLQEHYTLPETVELLDGGTLGLMLTPKIEEAERLYLIDVLDAPGQPGECFRYTKEAFLTNRLALKLSPHQAGLQEMLLVAELRGRCPKEVILLGVIPGCIAPGTELSPSLQKRIPELAERLVSELSSR